MANNENLRPDKRITKTPGVTNFPMPKPELPNYNKPEPQEPISDKGMTRRGFLKMLGGLGLVAGAVAFGAYKLELGPFDSTPKAIDVPSSFDPSTGEKSVKDEQTIIASVIGDNNTLNTTLEVVQNLPSFDSEGNPILYIAAPKLGEAINYYSTINRINGTYNGTPTVTDQLGITMKVGKDYIMSMPIDGDIIIINSTEGKFVGYQIHFNDTNEIRQTLGIGASSSFTSLQDIPEITVAEMAQVEKKSIFIKRGTQLLRTNQSTYINYGSPAINNLNLQPLTITDSSGLAKIPRVE